MTREEQIKRYDAMKEWNKTFDACAHDCEDSTVYAEAKKMRDEYEKEMKHIECNPLPVIKCNGQHYDKSWNEEREYYRKNTKEWAPGTSLFDCIPQSWEIVKNPNPLNL